MDENNALQELVYLTSNVMEGFTVALFLIGHDEKEKIYLHAYDSFCKNIKEDCVLGSGEGLIGWVFREQKPVIANNFERDTSTLKIYKKDENIKSLMAVPLPKKKGVIFVDSKKNYSFTEEKEKLLKNISNIIFYFLIKEEYSIFERNIIKLYKLYIDVDEILINNDRSISKKIDDLLRELDKTLELYLGIFFIKNVIYVYNNHTCNTVGIKNELSENNFISLLLKNKKSVFRNSIKYGKKFCIVFNKKKYDNISNYLYIPLVSDFNRTKGCLFLCKCSGRKWDKDEVKFLEKLGKTIFIKMSGANG